MDSKILFSITVLLVISTGSIFAQEPLISVQTDDNNYEEGDTIVISGIVTTQFIDTPVLLQIIHDGAFIEIRQIEVAQDGSFSKTIIAEGNVWNRSGEYITKVFYQDQSVETSFNYISAKEIETITENFEVDAESFGTFDVKYSIIGGTVKDMIVDSEGFAVVVKIDALDEGKITLELPREFIGAEKQDGKDDTFIILIDGIEVNYVESTVHSEFRVITINFEQGDSDIEIIGTYVIPEFGAITMIILIVGIMATVLVARNKLQIKI